MRGFLGYPAFNIDDDYHSHNAFQRRLLCAQPNNQADRRLLHLLRHARAVSGSPYTLAATPYCIAIAPGGGFLYVGTNAGIYLYTIGSGGALTAGNSGGTISSDIPAAMQVTGSWLVDAFAPNYTGTSVQIDAIPINATTGLYAGPGGAPPSQTFNNLTNAAVKQWLFLQMATMFFWL